MAQERSGFLPHSHGSSLTGTGHGHSGSSGPRLTPRVLERRNRAAAGANSLPESTPWTRGRAEWLLLSISMAMLSYATYLSFWYLCLPWMPLVVVQLGLFVRLLRGGEIDMKVIVPWLIFIAAMQMIGPWMTLRIEHLTSAWLCLLGELMFMNALYDGIPRPIGGAAWLLIPAALLVSVRSELQPIVNKVTNQPTTYMAIKPAELTDLDVLWHPGLKASKIPKLIADYVDQSATDYDRDPHTSRLFRGLLSVHRCFLSYEGKLGAYDKVEEVQRDFPARFGPAFIGMLRLSPGYHAETLDDELRMYKSFDWLNKKLVEEVKLNSSDIHIAFATGRVRLQANAALIIQVIHPYVGSDKRMLWISLTGTVDDSRLSVQLHAAPCSNITALLKVSPLNFPAYMLSSVDCASSDNG